MTRWLDRNFLDSLIATFAELNSTHAIHVIYYSTNPYYLSLILSFPFHQLVRLILLLILPTCRIAMTLRLILRFCWSALSLSFGSDFLRGQLLP